MIDDLELGWMKDTITKLYWLVLLKCKLAYEGWIHLERLLSPVSKTQMSLIRDQLRTIKRAGVESMQDYLVRVKGLMESFAAIGEETIESSLIDYMLQI